LTNLLNQRLQTGDVVTAKGSHGSKVYELVASLLASKAGV
jgi:hypothetical protein